MALLLKRWEDTKDLASGTMKARYWESCEMYPINWSVRKAFSCLLQLKQLHLWQESYFPLMPVWLVNSPPTVHFPSLRLLGNAPEDDFVNPIN